MDHLVTGWPAASNVAAAVGGTRWRDGTERKEEGEEVPEDGVLTQSVLGWPAGAGVAGRRRIGVRPRRPEAGKGADGAGERRPPGSIPWSRW